MRTPTRLMISFVLVLSVLRPAVAQENRSPTAEDSSDIVTAFASTDRVRFTAPSSVVQMHLEVYSQTAVKLFDFELKGGNVLDWHLQNGQAERINPGSYLCVVTVKSLSGKLTQKIGTINISEQLVSIEPTQASKLSTQQAQAVGPMEESSIITVLTQDEPVTTAVIAHNGEEAQISRGKGALSFRLGDFLRGKDQEQMRLSPEGNLGIGLTHPQARLDVDGLIRTSQGILFPDGTIQTTAAIAGNAGRNPDGTLLSGQIFSSTSQTSFGTGGKNKKKFSPELFVNEDLTVNGNIIFTPPSPQFTRDITMQNNNGGLRFFGAPTLTNSPAAAAIQFWGNNSPLPGQLYLDAGAHDSGAVIIRSTGTGGTIAERMRVTATGNVGIGTAAPLGKLQAVTVSDMNPTSVSAWDSRHFVVGGPATGFGGISISYNQTSVVGYIQALIPNEGWGHLVLQSGGGNVGVGKFPSSARLEVQGIFGTGVLGIGGSNGGAGVFGDSTTGNGVRGRSASESDSGVWGEATGSGYGVAGSTANGYAGVIGTGGQNGVFGQTSSTDPAFSGVYGLNNAGGHGVSGSSASGHGVFGSSTTGVGVYGLSSNGNDGVVGESRVANRSGVYGFTTNFNGCGGCFENRAGGIALGVTGIARVSVLEITGGGDLAEKFDVAEEAKPGMVVAIDRHNAGKLSIARGAYNRRAAGVISGVKNLSAGMVLPDVSGGKQSVPVALSGRVWVYCDATRNSIKPGDLLTTSATPGHAMRVTNHGKAQGAIIGKAMTGLKSGRGLVLVLVTLQ